MRYKTKLKTELRSKLDKNGKLVWTEDACLRTWMKHIMVLLNIQADNEDIPENIYTTENSNVPDKIEVNILDIETLMRHTKNNKPQGYAELSTDMIKVTGPTGTQ
jgi:hypothetical protein